MCDDSTTTTNAGSESHDEMQNTGMNDLTTQIDIDDVANSPSLSRSTSMDFDSTTDTRRPGTDPSPQPATTNAELQTRMLTPETILSIRTSTPAGSEGANQSKTAKSAHTSSAVANKDNEQSHSYGESRTQTMSVSDGDENDKKDGKASPASTSTSTLSTTGRPDNEELDAITQKMGQLWWPASNEDLTRINERDKYGCLVHFEDTSKDAKGIAESVVIHDNGELSRGFAHQMDGSNSGTSDASVQAGDNKSTEWYDKVFNSVHAATANLVGNLEDTSNNIYERVDDPKLKISMALTKTIDKFWAKELYAIDAKEREVITNEIHGVKSTRVVEETPQSIETAIRDFRTFLENNIEEELDNGDSIVPPVTKDAYKRGLYELRSDYITSKAFLLKFLRICHYNMEQAALRYFRYLDLLYLLFGDDSLMRPLALTDLTKREFRYLRKGQMQLLPSRDRAGRRIFAFSGCDDLNFNIREKYRVNIYLVDVLSDDEQTQKLGAVSLNAPRVRYDPGVNPFSFEGMTLRVGKEELLGGECTEAQFFRKINEAVPIRFSAIHYFAPQTLIYNIGRAIILSLLGKDHRKIVRFHAGSLLECSYSLRSFGILHEDITITEGNNIKTKNVQKFINARRSIESFREKRWERKIRRQQSDVLIPLEETPEEECPGIECPEVNCIVFGDKAMNVLPGNIEFREILQVMERQREEQVKSFGGDLPPIKQFIESIIVRARSTEHNLRFLVFDRATHLFADIKDHNKLCKRVSQALRDQRKRSRVQEKQLAAERGSLQQPRAAAAGANAGTSSDSSTDATGMERKVTSSGDVLEEAGASIMGLSAAKRLKRSYNNNSPSSSEDGNFFFCSRQS